MKTVVSLIALGAVALAAAGPVSAAGARYNAAGMKKVAAEPGASPLGSGNVKLAYSYTRGFGVDRSVNVATFSSPSTGIYCIQPAGKVGLTGIYPLVSIEWSLSFGESLQAFWVDTSNYSDCPKKALEVQTYDISTGTAPVLTSNAAFDIVVP